MAHPRDIRSASGGRGTKEPFLDPLSSGAGSLDSRGNAACLLSPSPPPHSFALVLKYLAFMNAAAGCINYTTLFHAAETQRTVPPPGI